MVFFDDTFPTVGGWTWANNEGIVGKLSEAMKFVRQIWEAQCALRNGPAHGLAEALQHGVETQGRRPGKDFGAVGHACRLFELKELADPSQKWTKVPKNPER